MAVNLLSNRMATGDVDGLSDDCWEYVISKLLNDNVHGRNRYLDTLSLVSKQLLSIINCSVYSITLINNPSSLSCLFQRFPNLTSLDLSSFRGDLDTLLSRFPHPVSLPLTSLNLSNHPTLGLRTILKNNKSTFSHLFQSWFSQIYRYDLHRSFSDDISYFLSKCRSLQHLDLQRAKFLNDHHFNELSAFLVDLVSINVSDCNKLTNSTFFALLRNCPLLNEIRMEATKIGIGSMPSVDSVVYHQVKSLHLACNSHLKDEHMNMFAFMFPNMQFLDLCSCHYISQEGIGIVLKRCCKIRHLNIAFHPQPKLIWINFEASKLEVLNLSHTRIDDEVLYAIPKRFPLLLHLDLEHCHDVTEKGVRLVVENCIHLREINLRCCYKVSADIVAKLILLRHH